MKQFDVECIRLYGIVWYGKEKLIHLWCVLAFLYHNQVPEAGHLWRKRAHSFSDWSPDFMVQGPLSIDLSPHDVGSVGSKESISEQEAGVAAWGQAQHCMTVQATKLTKIRWEYLIPSWGHFPSDLRGWTPPKSSITSQHTYPGDHAPNKWTFGEVANNMQTMAGHHVCAQNDSDFGTS